jgi:hypothetical protein
MSALHTDEQLPAAPLGPFDPSMVLRDGVLRTNRGEGTCTCDARSFVEPQDDKSDIGNGKSDLRNNKNEIDPQRR